MNYCRKCGAPLPENAKFCTSCGTPVEAILPHVPQVAEQVEEVVPAVPEPETLFEETSVLEEAVIIPEPEEIPMPEETPAVLEPELPFEEPVLFEERAVIPPPAAPVMAEIPAAPPVPPPPVQVQAPPPAYQPPPQQPQSYAPVPPPVPAGQPPYQYGGAPPYPQQQPVYPQQQAYAQGYPGYPPAPQPKKKKRWWIPVVIIAVILALLAGVWALFGQQISNVFASTDKRWKKAETSAGLIPEGSLLETLRESSGEMLKQDTYGSKTELTLDVKADALPDEYKEILAVLTALRFSIENKVDTKASRFHTSIGLGKRGDSQDALTVDLYDVSDHLVIALPQVLKNPLALPKSALEDLMDSDDLGVSFNDLFASSGALQESLAAFTDKGLDEIADGLKEIFIKHAGSPELIKGESLTVGGVTQKLDYYKVTIPEDRFPAMAKDMITFMRDSKDIKNLLQDLDKAFSIPAGGYYDSIYESFVEGMNDALEELADDPDDFQVRTERRLYVDKKNKPVGGQFTFTKVEGGEEESFVLTSYHVEDGSDQAQLLRLEVPDGSGLEFLSEYTVKSDRYSGNFTIRSKESEWYEATKFETVAKGSFTDFELKQAGKNLYPVGKLDMELTLDDSGYGTPEKVKLTYQGKLESSDRLLASLEIAISGELPITITLGLDHKALPAKEIVFVSDLPANYIDLMDEDAMMGLMMDESLMTNLMSVLEDLGIDPEALDLLGGGSSWDDDDWDWDDDEWEWDWGDGD